MRPPKNGSRGRSPTLRAGNRHLPTTIRKRATVKAVCVTYRTLVNVPGHRPTRHIEAGAVAVQGHNIRDRGLCHRYEKPTPIVHSHTLTASMRSV